MSKNENSTPNTNQEELFADTNISMKSGRLVKDAELISDGQFVKIRLASNKQYLDANNEVQSMTNYFNILISSNLQDAFNIAKDLKKGEWAYIKGEDNSKSFDTPEGYKQTAITTFAYKVVKKQSGEAANADEEQNSSIPQPA